MTHKLTHSEEILKCDLCSAVFKCRKYLENHQIRKHKIDKPINIKNEMSEIKEEIVESCGDDYVEEPPQKKVRYEIDSEDFDKFLSKHLH